MGMPPHNNVRQNHFKAFGDDSSDHFWLHTVVCNISGFVQCTMSRVTIIFAMGLVILRAMAIYLPKLVNIPYQWKRPLGTCDQAIFFWDYLILTNNTELNEIHKKAYSQISEDRFLKGSRYVVYLTWLICLIMSSIPFFKGKSRLPQPFLQIYFSKIYIKQLTVTRTFRSAIIFDSIYQSGVHYKYNRNYEMGWWNLDEVFQFEQGVFVGKKFKCSPFSLVFVSLYLYIGAQP